MSSVIGGCNSVSVAALDSAYKPTETTTRRIGRNQQLVLKEEVYLYKVADPSQGSYYIEELTQKLAENAWELFVKISEMGGFRAALENGFIFDEIAKSAAEKDLEIAMRRTNLLGVNQFPNIAERKADEVKIEKRPSKGGLKIYRGAEAFEEMRLKTEAFEKAGNPTPHVFLITIGDLTMRKARANFALNFFGCAGFKITDNLGFESVAEGLKAANDSGADLIVICSSDEEYLSLAQQVSHNHERIIIAGYPTETLEDIKKAGIENFIHARCNVLEELNKYQTILGI
jgi:methylmalonyl-CoA mutase